APSTPPARAGGPAARAARAAAPSHAPMNRYPLWKYVVIALALVVGLLYAVPNLFPEVPAVQVSSSKTSVKIDSALLATVEAALKSANIAYKGDALDPTGVKVRFA